MKIIQITQKQRKLVLYMVKGAQESTSVSVWKGELKKVSKSLHINFEKEPGSISYSSVVSELPSWTLGLSQPKMKKQFSSKRQGSLSCPEPECRCSHLTICRAKASRRETPSAPRQASFFLVWEQDEVWSQ